MSVTRSMHEPKKQGKKPPLVTVPVLKFLFEVFGLDLHVFESKGCSYLAVVDYLTKWPIVKKLDSVCSESLVEVLEEIVADYGILRK